MKNLPISVIVTTYNDAEYLSNAIESVFNQNSLPSQLVIVDDGSDSDESRTITNRYTNNKKNIIVSYFKKENGGASSARNLGIENTDQRYVTFLDADDKMLPDNLNVKYKEIKNLNSNYFGVYGSGITNKGRDYNFINTDGVACTSYVGKFKVGIPGGCYYYLFRTSELVNIGGFDEELSNNEDFDILIRLLKSGKACKGSVGCGNFINVRENSLSRDLNSEKVFNKVMGFLDKAERENYFSIDELNYRRKTTHLSLVRRIILKQPFKAFIHVRHAFSYSKPVGKKEKILYKLCLCGVV